jgi:hypothetical protein
MLVVGPGFGARIREFLRHRASDFGIKEILETDVRERTIVLIPPAQSG